MLAFSLAVLLFAAVAFLLLRRADPGSGVDRIAGESMILAPAIPAAALFVASLVGIPWSRLLLFACGVIALAALLVVRRARPAPVAPINGADATLLDSRVAATIAAVLVVLLLAGYAQYAFVTAGAENDFIGIWGAKGRTFFESRGIDWEYLSSHWRGYAHPDYPLLTPLVFSSVAIASGGWNESLLGLVYPFVAAGGIVLVFSELRRRTSRASLRWFGTLAVAPFVMSPWIGLADGLLTVMVLAALLRLARWIDDGSAADLAVGSLFLGLAMSTKNEGLALGLVALFVVAIRTPRESRSRLVALWPAAAIAVPWLVLRSVHRLSTDLFEDRVLTRLADRVRDGDYIAALARHLVEFRPGPWFVYLLMLLAVALFWKRTRGGQRFVVVVVAVQLLIDLGAYLVTPLPLEWHVRWSWERLVAQLGAVFAVTAVALLVEVVEDSGGRGLATLVGPGPEIENEKADPDADR